MQILVQLFLHKYENNFLGIVNKQKMNGLQLKQKRIKYGLSQIDLAKLLECSPRSMINYENSESLPAKVVAAIERVFASLPMPDENLRRTKELSLKNQLSPVPSTATTMEVPLVNQYAYAGYLDSYQNTNYMNELPKIPFFVDHFGKGNYMAFEVRGDSMDDGSSDSILNGDILLCRELGRQHWQSRLHITKYDFVIVHKTDGIIIKRITAHNVDTGDVTIHSLNTAYPDYQINLDDVNQLFNVLKIERKR